MTQYMRFQQGNNNVNFSEVDEKGNNVEVSYWNASSNSFGTVHFDEKHLKELRKWITIQIRKMKLTPKLKSKTP